MFRLSLVFVLQCLVLYRNVCSEEIFENNVSIELSDLTNRNDLKEIESAEHEHKTRATNVMRNIAKQSALNFWHSIKTSASNTKNKIQNWIQNVKANANRLILLVQDRVLSLKSQIIKITQQIKDASGIFKKCLEKEKDNIEKTLKKLLEEVTSCISGKVTSLSTLENNYKLTFNDEEFINKLESKLNTCAERRSDAEGCFLSARRDVMEEISGIETDILRTGIEAKTQTDGILDSILNCSTDGLMKASSMVMNEIMEIIKCTLNG